MHTSVANKWPDFGVRGIIWGDSFFQNVQLDKNIVNLVDSDFTQLHNMTGMYQQQQQQHPCPRTSASPTVCKNVYFSFSFFSSFLTSAPPPSTPSPYSSFYSFSYSYFFCYSSVSFPYSYSHFFSYFYSSFSSSESSPWLRLDPRRDGSSTLRSESLIYNRFTSPIMAPDHKFNNSRWRMEVEG